MTPRSIVFSFVFAMVLSGCRIPLDSLVDTVPPYGEGPLKLTEIVGTSNGSWVDENKESSDWFELENSGTQDLDLSKFGVSRSSHLDRIWVFPNQTLPAGKRLVVAASGQNRRPKTGVLHTDFNLPTEGSTLYLWKGTDLIDKVTYPALAEVESFALFEGGWELTNVPTPGQTNQQTVKSPGSAYPLKISEVQSANSGVWFDDAGRTSDWIELTNQGKQALDLGEFSIGNHEKVPGAWAFPTRTLAPGEKIVIAASGEDRRPTNGELHTDFVLSASGDSLYLWHGTLAVDQVVLPALVDGQSYALLDGTWQISTQPTPGAENVTGIPEPGFSHPGGLITQSSVSLRLSAVGTIRYTLDGSDPDATSPAWTVKQLTLKDPDSSDGLPGGVVVSARVERQGALGAIVRKSYLFYPPGSPGAPGGASTTVAVISLAGKPTELVDAPDGLLNRDHDLYDGTEVGLNFEFYEPGSSYPGYTTKTGAQLFGAASRSFNVQKALGLHARSRYQEGKFRYPFFPGLVNDRGREVEEFDSLVLRAAGNDSGETLLRDIFMSGLVKGMDVDYQAYRPAAVFVNGQYWGFYQLREKVNEDFVTMHHPAITGQLSILSNYNEVNAGTSADFDALLAYLGANSPADPAVWDRLSSWVDIDEFTDYQIAQIYFGNTDWPGNNTKYWRTSSANSSWRWILYDTDFGFGLATNPDHDTLSFALEAYGPGWPNPPVSTLLFRRLLENTAYQAQFLARFRTLLNTKFSVATVSAYIDKVSSEARDEILSRHWIRWNNSAMSAGYPGYTDWDGRIQGIKDWVSQRVPFLKNLLENYFEVVPVVRSNGTGLKAEYFAGTTSLAGSPLVTTVDPTVDWVKVDDSTVVVAGVGPDNFSVRWTGTLRSSITGNVRLTMSGDDGVRLWINNEADPIIDGWRDQGTTSYSAFVSLVSGQDYPLKVEYYQGGGGGEVHLTWSLGQFNEIIPATQLFPAP